MLPDRSPVLPLSHQLPTRRFPRRHFLAFGELGAEGELLLVTNYACNTR
jgi:hypothetical protein